jgi:uncharacterized protein YxeA
MKRLFVMVMVGMFLAQSMVAQKRATSDRELYLLKGPVKTVRVERAEIKLSEGQATEGRRQLQSITTYDETGNMLEAIRCNYDGSVLDKTVFTHDGVRKQTETTSKADGTVISKLIYSYDAEGREIGSSLFGADGNLRHTGKRNYAPDGKQIEAALFNPDGSLMNRTVFNYDSEGKHVEDVVYNATGQVMQGTASSGDQLKAVLYNEDGTIFYESVRQAPTREYDSRENWIKQIAPTRVSQGGITKESIEVIYRTITYY